MDDTQCKFTFPEGCSAATAGVILPGGREVVTGLANGGVYKWDMRDGSYDKMFDGISRISAIDMRDGTLLISAKDGPLITIDADSHKVETLRQWSQSQSSRIWKCAWLGDGRAVMTSTYGGIYIYERSGGGAWEYSPLHGHVHSVFAVGVHEELMATGDWSGRIVAWERLKGSYSATSSIHGMSGAVEALVWVDSRKLIGIDANGLIRQFEFDPHSDRWAAVYELDVAVGQGTSMHLAGNKKTLLASTQAEVVQVDLETLQYKTFPVEGAIGFHCEEDTACIMTGDGVYTLPIGTIEEPPDMVKYKHIKVSLVGHTGVGKSTLCNTMSRMASVQRTDAKTIRSTFGRRVWPLKIGDGKEATKQQVMLHDHGGQRSVLPTFLQASEDSDMVLALFSQTDRSTFDAACDSLKRVRTGRSNGAARRFLVATHADHELRDVTDDDLQYAIEDAGADGFLRINALTEDGAKEVRGLFDDARLWRGASRVVKSKRSLAVEIALDYWKSAEDRSVLSLHDIKSGGKDLVCTAIPEAHLDYLLRSMDRRGLLTYYSEIGQVVLNDEDHDKVRSGIPMLAEHYSGIVEEGRIEQEYGTSRYTKPVLSALKTNGSCIACRDRLVFPHLLRDGAVRVPDRFRERLKNPLFSDTLAFDAERIDAAALIKAAAGLNLPCVDATKTGALFASEGGAGLYYSVSSMGDPLEGLHTQIAYRVSGTRKVFCKALADEFTILVRRIAGSKMLQYIRAPAVSA